MHILTDTIEDNDRCIDRITYDRQHTCNKGSSHGNLYSCIECKHYQYIMQQCDHGACTEPDILEPQPDIDQHTERCDCHCKECIRLHLTADGRADGFRRNFPGVHTKVINHYIFKAFSLIQT